MVTLLALASAAHACGGFVPTAGKLAASDAQQALFDLGADSITVTYRARYEGDAADFAWVLAVPGGIAAVEEGDGDRLDALVEASAPTVEVDPAITDESGGGCGCGSSDYAGGLKNDRGGGGGDTGVTVTGSGFAGDFEYTTLSATDADALKTWLDDHGYDTTLIAPAIADYVADALGYEFVAVQLRPDVETTPEGGVVLDPLAITYGAGADGFLHAVFPAKLGQSSTVGHVRTEILVLGTGTATISGWEGVANPDEKDGHAWDVAGPDYVDPSGLYTQLLLHHGDTQRKAWEAFAGAVDDGGTERWLTRYDALVTPATNSIDPEFADGTSQTAATTVIYVQDETTFEDEVTATEEFYIAGAGMLGLAGWLRRRRAR